ncbi:brisc and brca1-a complex member 2 [Quercus suber]|uniref:BRISC and BRCA1-A complex member 2 n=1 Tax=Quercus suber TaxID=58331 RepID=A0AAW0K9E4_QUESU
MASDGVPPIIAAQLNYLLSHFPLSVKIEHLWSGSKFSSGVIDRFTIILVVLVGDFIYNSESPISAPDVIFGAEDENFLSFLARNDGVEGNANSAKNCLSDWNGKDPTRLMVLLQQLRDQYMNYQRKRVDEVDDDRLKFEVSTIAFRERKIVSSGFICNLTYDTAVVLWSRTGKEPRPEEVKFAVPLTEMNIDKMVHGCPWRHSPKIYLQVIYPVGRKYVSASSAPRLKLLSTSDLKSIFSIEDFKLPPWLDGMCMAEYLPHLEESLEKQILEAVSLIDVRRRFIESLAPLFGRPLEADPPEEVKFAVPLTEMNIDKMVHGCPWRHSPKIYLQVIYPVGRKYVSASSAPRLKLLSTSDLKSIFSIEDFKLPPWLDGMCMAEYLPHLEESLEKQILEAVSLIDVRRRFIESLAPLFGRPLEADPIFCRKATFLAGSGAFTFLVHFSISTQFPKQQPGLMLQSSQHMNSHGVPAKSPLITEYPWSPRWETSVMAEKIFEFLVDEALNFKRYCNEAQLQH